jgi:hypothetical protein
MRSARTRFFAIALAAGLGGCGSVHWHKAGADDAALAKDLEECRSLARQKLGIVGAFGPPPTLDPRFGAPSGPSPSDAMMQEAQATGACMREKGYELVPDKK